MEIKTPFDIISSINKKEYSYTPEISKNINPWILNKYFSCYPDTVLISEISNCLKLISPEMLYDFYFYATPKKQRKFIPNMFKGKGEENNNDIQRALSVLYSYSEEEALEASQFIVTEQQRKELLSQVQYGGITK